MTQAREARLSEYAATLEARPSTAAARERLGQGLFDWFTAGLSGASLPAAARLGDLAQHVHGGGTGKAAVFGSAVTLPSTSAAFANAAVTHLREIDDAHRAAMMHPGIVAIPPVLALAAHMPISRRRVAAAVSAGYEVALRCGEALGQGHYQLFHTTATAGSIGAAAATGVALGLDAQQLHHALGLAATQAAGLWQIVDDGAHASKVLHPAFAVRNGMTAAFAAQAGFPGPGNFFTGKRGLYAVLSGDGPLDALDAGLGTDDRAGTATIKAWPTCGQMFTLLDSLRFLMDAHHPAPDQIESIDVRIYPQALKVASIDWPAVPHESTFSPRYCAAALLTYDRLGLAQTQTPALDSVPLRALAARINIVADETFGRAFPTKRPCRVTVTMRDGRSWSESRDTRRGDPEDPFDWPGLQMRLQAFAPDTAEAVQHALLNWCQAFALESNDDAICEVPRHLFGAARA